MIELVCLEMPLSFTGYSEALIAEVHLISIIISILHADNRALLRTLTVGCDDAGDTSHGHLSKKRNQV